MDIKIYTTPTCGYCHQAKRFLTERGVKFTEFDVSRDRVAAEELVRATGQRAVPVIMVDGEVIVGFDRARLEQLLSQKGDRHPRFGLKVADAAKMAQKSGAFVGSVAPSSLGEKAGIRSGDIITQVNQTLINDTRELENTLATLMPGNRVTIVFLHGEQTLKSEIVI